MTPSWLLPATCALLGWVPAEFPASHHRHCAGHAQAIWVHRGSCSGTCRLLEWLVDARFSAVHHACAIFTFRHWSDPRRQRGQDYRPIHWVTSPESAELNPESLLSESEAD